MIKKERPFTVQFRLDEGYGNLSGAIGQLVEDKREGIAGIRQYKISPTYGSGSVYHCQMDDIELTISKFTIGDDLCYEQYIKEDCVIITYLLQGEKMLLLDNGKELACENGESYMALLKGFKGVTKIYGNQLFKEIKLRFPLSFLERNGADAGAREFAGLGDENVVLPISDGILAVLEQLMAPRAKGISGYIYLKAKALELLALQLQHKKENPSCHLGNLGPTGLKKIYKVRKVLNENLHKNLSLGELAMEVGLQQNALNQEFKRLFGYTVQDYFYSEKMKKAQDRLENTSLLVYQIAEEVGYKNATHFTAAFRRQFGITPKQYRKKLHSA